jgi:peptidoglycan LD-endopeptidase LytH
MQKGKNINQHFHPVILGPEQWPSVDLSGGYNPDVLGGGEWGAGGYAERRPGMYTSAIFGGRRYIHMGIDFWAPAGTPVYSFCDGRILIWRDNDNPLDYGPTIVTEHLIKTGDQALKSELRISADAESIPIYALYGHLSRSSLEGLEAGRVIRAGEQIGELGSVAENGGWVPHLHFQISRKRPDVPDMPGVVAPEELEEALETYPDPGIFLGPFLAGFKGREMGNQK